MCCIKVKSLVNKSRYIITIEVIVKVQVEEGTERMVFTLRLLSLSRMSRNEVKTVYGNKDEMGKTINTESRGILTSSSSSSPLSSSFKGH